MKAPQETEGAVKAAMNRFAESYAKRDIAALLSCFTPDADVMLYGTGADEKRIGSEEIRKQAERDWAQTEAASISFGWTLVSSAGAVAWVAADASFTLKAGGQSMELAGRLTAVLEQRGGQWLIAQSHFSFPSGAQAEGESFPR